MANKLQLIQKLQQLNDFSQEEKAFIIDLLNRNKQYGLIWEDKEEEVEKLLLEHLPVLKEVKDKFIPAQKLPNTLNQLFEEPESVTDAPNHMLIEGDNLHALTTLCFTHENKIDVIYIDPPYNTGNKDFKYNDNYVDKEDSYRHSKWLSFMYKRLKLAKRLLKNTGVIFISIDDNEQAQLKLLCDEVFREENMVGQWSWYKSATPPNLSHKIKKNIEYVLGYEFKRNNSKYKGVKKGSKSTDPFTKPQNTMKDLCFKVGSILFPNIEDTIIEKGIYGTDKFPNELLNDLIIENGRNKNEVVFRNRFVWEQKKLDFEIENETKIFSSKTLVLSYKKANYNEEVPPNLIDETVDVTTTEEAGKALFEILGEKRFEYPKPVSLIKYLLGFKESSIILDFFAGSGTTGQAVMELNKDGGNRQFILCTNNELNGLEKSLSEQGLSQEEMNEQGICRAVTYKRLQKIIEGYTNSKGEVVEGLTNNNLRYYTTDFVGREKTIKNRKALTQLSTDLICIKENAYQINTEFSTKSIKLFDGLSYQVMVIYDDDLIPDAISIIQAHSNDIQFKVYVFAHGFEPYSEDFMEVLNQVTLCPLPEVIYEIYRNIMPKKKIIDDKNNSIEINDL
jgi:adenine-specific DNA-methyltransferase